MRHSSSTSETKFDLDTYKGEKKVTEDASNYIYMDVVRLRVTVGCTYVRTITSYNCSGNTEVSQLNREHGAKLHLWRICKDKCKQNHIREI